MMPFDFNLKAHIRGKDGECGKLAGLIINPDTRQVTDLIVKRGHLLTQQRVVPIATVQNALEDDVYLSIDSSELDQYPEYQLVEFEEPITGLGHQRTAEVAAPYSLHGASELTAPTKKQKIREGITSDHKVIEPGILLKNLDGKVGKVTRVAVDCKRDEITYLVVQRGWVFPEYLAVPIIMVDSVFRDHIMISDTDEGLANLPQYKDVVEANFLTK